MAPSTPLLGIPSVLLTPIASPVAFLAGLELSSNTRRHPRRLMLHSASIRLAVHHAQRHLGGAHPSVPTAAITAPSRVPTCAATAAFDGTLRTCIGQKKGA